MDQDKVKQLETEITSALASLRQFLSNAQSTTGALDVFLYQLKKELMQKEQSPEVPPPAP